MMCSLCWLCRYKMKWMSEGHGQDVVCVGCAALNKVNKKGWHDHDDLASAVVRLLNKVDEGGGMNKMMEINVCKDIHDNFGTTTPTLQQLFFVTFMTS